MTEGLYATMKTSMGEIVIRLFEDKAPKTECLPSSHGVA